MGTALTGLAVVVGLVGVVVPVLPGTALVLAAGVAWAVLVVDAGAARWVVVGVMAGLFAVGLVLKYALPGRRLAGALPRSTLVAGSLGALLGVVVLPPLGLLLGGVLATYLAEARRVGHGAPARQSTMTVLRAVGVGVLAELTAAVLMAATWLVGVVIA